MQTRLRDRFKAIGGTLSRFGSFGIIGGGLGGLRNLFVGSAFTAALAWPVKLAANLELVTAQMNVFIGDSNKTQQIILSMQKFAAVAGQSFESLAQQFRLLMTRDIGADEALESIKAMAALAGGSEEEFQQLTKALADVKSATRLNGEEMRQFKNTAFNPFVEIAKRTGETFDELKNRMEAGGIAFWEVRDALLASVRAGGHFHGMLQKIAETLIGQMRMAFNTFKLAVLPLGKEALKPITDFFKSINGLMPAFTAFVQQYRGVAIIILQSLAAIAAAATFFIGMGMALTLAGIALGGFVGLFATLSAIIGAIFSPVGLFLILLGELIAWFILTSDTAKRALAAIAGYFRKLAEVAKLAIAGIADALKAGDLNLAGEILWSGLEVLWLQGTMRLRAIWVGFKNWFLLSMIGIAHGAAKIFVNLAATLRQVFENVQLFIMKAGIDAHAFIEKLGKTEAQKEQIDQGAQAIKNMLIIAAIMRRNAEEKRDKELLSLMEKIRFAAEAVTMAGSAAELKAAQKRLKDAEARLKVLRDQAAALPAAPGDDLFPDVNFGGGLGAAGLAEAKNRTQAIATFDTRLAPQMFGRANEQELNQLKKIERNTRNANRRAGLPVV